MPLGAASNLGSRTLRALVLTFGYIAARRWCSLLAQRGLAQRSGRPPTTRSAPPAYPWCRPRCFLPRASQTRCRLATVRQAGLSYHGHTVQAPRSLMTVSVLPARASAAVSRPRFGQGHAAATGRARRLARARRLSVSPSDTDGVASRPRAAAIRGGCRGRQGHQEAQVSGQRRIAEPARQEAHPRRVAARPGAAPVEQGDGGAAGRAQPWQRHRSRPSAAVGRARLLNMGCDLRKRRVG